MYHVGGIIALLIDNLIALNTQHLLYLHQLWKGLKTFLHKALTLFDVFISQCFQFEDFSKTLESFENHLKIL